MAQTEEEKKAKKDSAAADRAEAKAFSVPGGADRLAALMASRILSGLVKAHGVDPFMAGNDVRIRSVRRLPSGVYSLDCALGGGWPAGHVNTIWGDPSTSKTTLALKAIAQAHRRCAHCFGVTIPGQVCCDSFRESLAAMIDCEGTFDKDWAEHLGVDLSRLIIATPASGEEATDIMDSFIRTGAVDVIVLDSIAFMVPTEEIEKASIDSLMAAQARLVHRFCRKVRSAINSEGREHGYRPTVFLINQTRSKVGLVFGSPIIMPAGSGPGFISTTVVKTTSAKINVVNNTPMFVEFGFRIEKNKSWTARKEGSFRMMLADIETRKMGDIWDEEEISKMAEELLLITNEKGKWSCLGETFDSRSKIDQRLIEDKVFCDKLRRATLRVLIPG